jgi:hypothetical protein
MKVFKAALGVDRPGRRPYLTGLTAWEHCLQITAGHAGSYFGLQ